MVAELRLFFGVHTKVHGAGHLIENQKNLMSFEILHYTRATSVTTYVWQLTATVFLAAQRAAHCPILKLLSDASARNKGRHTLFC